MSEEANRSQAGEVLFRLAMLTISSLLISVNLKSFVQAGDLFPGGFTGLARLTLRCFSEFGGVELPFAPVNLILNAVPAIISFMYVGKKFTLYSCLSIVMVSFFTDLIPSVPITEDLLLICVFGGLLYGVAISLCLKARVTTGGTDFIAIALSERKNKEAWSYVLCANVVMLLVAGWLFGWDRALYSIIFQFAGTQVIKMMDGESSRATLFIITGRESAGGVCAQIQDTNHTATLIEGVGLYNGEPCVMIYSVVSSGESGPLVRKIKETDPKAFINVIRTEKLHGKFYRRPRD